MRRKIVQNEMHKKESLEKSLSNIPSYTPGHLCSQSCEYLANQQDQFKTDGRTIARGK